MGKAESNGSCRVYGDHICINAWPNALKATTNSADISHTFAIACRHNKASLHCLFVASKLWFIIQHKHRRSRCDSGFSIAQYLLWCDAFFGVLQAATTSVVLVIITRFRQACFFLFYEENCVNFHFAKLGFSILNIQMAKIAINEGEQLSS